MHLHADHALFFERRQPLWRAVSALVLTAGVLVVNTSASSLPVSLVGCGAAAILLAVSRIRRVEIALTWALLLGVAAGIGGLFLQEGAPAFWAAAARVLCGVLWILWLGTQLDWASLRQLLLRAGLPAGVVGTLDHALMHGVLTQREWVRRRDGARLRLGAAHLPLATWSRLLGEGALQAFVRLERVEESGLLRSSVPEEDGRDEGVCIEQVDIARGDEVVLRGVELVCRPRELVVLCGPSGAGKSSLLRVLAGLDAPASGVLRRLGTSLTPETPLSGRLDGRVVLLSQNPEDHFVASTAAEDITWGLRQRGVDASEAHRRCVEIARQLRIEHVLERPCHALSFGEQRRVALAGLLVLEPKLLLLDEPTSGLDPVAAHELCTLVDESLQRWGGSCVWATHDRHALPSRAQRVVLLRDQRVLFDGPVTEGLSRPWLIRAGLAVPRDEEEAC